MTQPSSLLSLTMTNKDISSDYGENHADVNSQIVINDVLAFKNNECRLINRILLKVTS